MQAGGRIPIPLWLLLGVLFTAGCRANTELLETELRVRDGQFRQTLEELSRLELHNEALQRELHALRHGQPIAPEHAAVTFGLRRITLGRGTGGYDADGLPGDEALQVVVEPRDADGHVIKAPGSLHISVLEIAPEGLKRPLSWWEFGPEQLRPSWKQGLLSTGYSLLLPWSAFPSTETVRVIAQMKLSDGRVFEAEKDVKVRLVAGAPRLAHPPLPPPQPHPAPLPPPHPVPLPVLPSPQPLSEPIGPALTADWTAHLPPRESTRWTAAPLQGSVQIGRPEPLSAPPTPPPLPDLGLWNRR